MEYVADKYSVRVAIVDNTTGETVESSAVHETGYKTVANTIFRSLTERPVSIISEGGMRLLLDNWLAGKGGCGEHKTQRSGSCHECAMNQPDPEDL